MPFAELNGLRLHYARDGAGPPLVLIAGMLSDHASWAPVLPALAARFTVIRPDNRTTGQTTPAEAPAGLAEWAGDVVALLDHLGIERAAILGTSRGGIIGMYLSATAPDRLRGLFLNDVGPVLDPLGLSRIKEYVGRRPAARTHAAAAIAMPHVAFGFANVPPERWMAEARLHFVETPQGLEITYDPALRLAFQRALDAPQADSWPLFDACCGKPLALIRGAGSDLLSAATAAEMARRCPAMIHEDVPDRGHIPFLDEPLSLSVIHRWLGLML